MDSLVFEGYFLWVKKKNLALYLEKLSIIETVSIVFTHQKVIFTSIQRKYETT